MFNANGTECITEDPNCSKYEIDGDKYKCVSCITSYYLDKKNGNKCMKGTIDHCLFYEDEKTCLKCERDDEWKVSSDKSKCVPQCPFGCDYCDDNGKCTKCIADEMHIVDNKCVLIDETCQRYNKEYPNRCEMCRTGYFMTSSYVCEKCNTEKCPGGCIHDKETCINIDEVNVIEGCEIYMKNRAGCYSCEENFDLIDGFCVKRNGGAFTCSEKTDTGVCTKCWSNSDHGLFGYLPTNGECLPLSYQSGIDQQI